LGICSTGPDGTEVIDAIGRYFLMEDGKGAEMAFIVRESKRRLGMAQTLLHALTDIARKRGLNELVAQVQRENHAMIALFRQAGASFRSVLGADAVDVRLPLHPAPL
jgi:RimJ/RimL family protein N-acetyltransferase